MNRTTAVLTAALLTAAALAAPAAAATPEVITVDTGQQQGPLRKPGLGTLFGVAARPATPKDLVAGSQVTLSQHQSLQGDAGYPTSTEAVTGVLAGTGVLMDGRFNDLMGGWPYVWKGLPDWLAKVDSGTRSIQAYRNLLYGIAPLNEPDNKLGTGPSSPFLTDPAVPGATYDDKVNWLWTQTVRRIRSIDPTVPILGPNYEHYNPWEAPDRQPRMRAFLVNAIATGTVPDIIGWHSLGPSPGDVPESLTRYYRPLERELGLAPRPVSIEEYGPGTGDFEGVPGSMAKHWAELARYGVDWATMGIYTNPGLLGNTLRRTYGGGLKPNGGWYFMNWYKQLSGTQVAVSRWDTRHYQAADGVAAWDPAARSATLLTGGEDADVDVRFTGLAARGLGPQVRVRVDYTAWTTDPNATDTRVERGGDPQTGTYNVTDRTMTLDAAGGLTVPIHRMEGYHGYRVIVSPVAAPGTHPGKYEAEQARVTDARLYDGYVGGIDHPDSSVAFTVTAPAAGLYAMTARYANGTTAPATHLLTVNGQAQGAVSYRTTDGWTPSETRTVTRRVRLAAGTNTVTLAKGDGYAELDAIDVRPDTHRYEAEYAAVTGARISAFRWDEFPDYVGGLDAAGSGVDFAVDVPVAGTYRLSIGYANGTTAPASHAVLVNGTQQATAAYAPTGGWFDTPEQDGVENQAVVAVSLAAGVNHVVLRKDTGYAELDYLTVG